MKLNRENLDQLPDSVAVPSYDVDRVVPGVVHLGFGNFHRAHEGVYLDRILESGDLRWGTVGVGFREPDRALNRASTDQDGLYTLETVSPTGESEVRVMGNVVEHIFAPDNAARLLDYVSDPAIPIISLTITEGGYIVPDVASELDPANPGPLGAIVLGAERRMNQGTEPFTVVSCDNIEMNGDVAREVILDLAQKHSPRVREWIESNVAFPNSMVDRITPSVDRALLERRSAEGIEDGWPVRAETYLQWVLEDNFSSDRPAFETVGVQVVDNVKPYEKMKLRLLNASHQVLAYVGLLDGMVMVDQVVKDPDYAAFLRQFMDVEARPTLDPVPGIDLDLYEDQLLARFGAKATEDTLARLVVDASERIEKFVIPVLADQLARTDGGAPQIDRIMLAIAAWYTYMSGVDRIDDQNAERILGGVRAEADSPGAFLDAIILDEDLASSPMVRQKFEYYKNCIASQGLRATVQAVLAGSNA